MSIDRQCHFGSFRICRTWPYNTSVIGSFVSTNFEGYLMSANPCPSLSDLHDIVAHLEYEYRMLWSTASLLSRYQDMPALSDDNQDAANSFLESFAVHARNLKEFFFHSPSEDNVRAEHFFSDPEVWKKGRLPMPTEIKEIDRLANKQISHLTYARVALNDDERTWNVAQITNAFGAEMSRFTRLLTSCGKLRFDLPVSPPPTSSSPQLLAGQGNLATDCRTLASSSASKIYPSLQAKTEPARRPS